ncbi:type VI secretion system Vgr family protein [Crenobacter sp. SG2305]|uniref:type VI secretion system Vgr family protein n=1 Tax=Crenobacter oryzisoli TaxID=3056844 RepID=UPI0025AB1CB4|nr:type VI secretion system Vgr family protein [Crenobacter sp. SG2305]MDN0083414.1 type VI secretion system Vgr family protein [Crenobacter sp. SG2305]
MDLSTLLASFAAAFTQDTRLLTLALGDGRRWADALLPQTLTGEEALSDSYRYQLTCLSPDADLALKELLGQPVRLTVQDADGTQVARCGVVSSAQALGSDGGFAKYGLTIEPPLALLRHRRTSRVFQDLSVPDIVQQVLAEHQAANPGFAQVQHWQFPLSGEASLRSYCLQYRESDYDFIVRLLHEEGYHWHFVHQGDEGTTPSVTLVVSDDPYRLPAAPLERVRFHRSDATEAEDGLTDWRGSRQIVPGRVSLASFDYQPVSTQHSGDASRVEQGDGGHALQASLEDYDPQGLYYAGDTEQLGRYAQLRQQAHDAQAKSFDGAGSVRGLLAGAWFRLDGHPAHDADPAEQREFVVTRQTFTASNNLPGELTRQLRAAAPGLFAQDSTQGQDDAPPTPFQTRFQAQRRGLPLPPAYAHSTQAKPTSRGVQTATVVGPADAEVHTDQHGRIKVQFHWQRPDEHPTIGANLDDKSSCWLRVAMPSAGAGWGHQFIPRIGQEVLVDFIEGDIDRPVITGVLYNGSHPPPAFSGAGSLPANKTLSGIKSKEHRGGQYNELLFDDTPGEVRAKLSSEAGKTQLNQGFLIHPRSDGQGQPRGDGFELRTDQHGAIRAAHGLLLSTEAQPSAGGKQLARDHAQSQLDAALSLSQSLADTATAQLADTMETGPEQIQADNSKGAKKTDGHLQHHAAALKAWEAGNNTDKDAKTAQEQAGQQPLLVLSAPAGIASVTEQSQTVAAGTNLDLIAQRDTNQTSGRRWIHNVGQHLSLFVAGVKDAISLKLIAAKGKVQVQAQSDSVEVTADKDVNLTAIKGQQLFNGKKEILLTCGGAYVRIKDGKIELHAPGKISFKGGSHDWSGGTSSVFEFPLLPGAKQYDEGLLLKYPDTGQPLKNRKYIIQLESGRKLTGTTDSEGKTQRVITSTPIKITSINIMASEK